MMRLNRFLASVGVASRRKCDEIINSGRVKVNGKIVTKLGVTIDEEKDIVEFDGQRLKVKTDFTYVLLNKPVEVLSSVSDRFRRQTVVDLVATPQRIFPVGRLDYDTSGVLLLTDNGDITYKLLHPKFKTPKIYHVLVNTRVRPVDLHHLRNGVVLDGKKTQPCKIREIRVVHNASLLEIELKEGRNRQIRRMFESFGYTVEELDRVSFAGLTYSGLKPGQWRYLTSAEIKSLQERTTEPIGSTS